MKGDYTRLTGGHYPYTDGDHPQMKGDYTTAVKAPVFASTKTTPK